jgi:molecular chaperone DnaJ
MDVPSALRLLSLNPPFDHDDLKQAYRRMALQYHPDKNKSDNAKMEFQALTEARCLLEWYTLPI